MSKPGSVSSHRSRRQLLEQVFARDPGARRHDQAAQRRTVVVALEPAFAHLPEGHECEHFARPAGDIHQRDVGQQVDVDHLAGEQLDGCGVARDQSEGAPGREHCGEGGGARCHRRPFIGSGGRSNEKDRPRAVCDLGTRTHRRQRAGHQEVRFADMGRNYHSTPPSGHSASVSSSISLPCRHPTVS